MTDDMTVHPTVSIALCQPGTLPPGTVTAFAQAHSGGTVAVRDPVLGHVTHIPDPFAREKAVLPSGIRAVLAAVRHVLDSASAPMGDHVVVSDYRFAALREAMFFRDVPRGEVEALVHGADDPRMDALMQHFAGVAPNSDAWAEWPEEDVCIHDHGVWETVRYGKGHLRDKATSALKAIDAVSAATGEATEPAHAPD